MFQCNDTCINKFKGLHTEKDKKAELGQVCKSKMARYIILL